MFLLDELLQGTNSRDRRSGAERNRARIRGTRRIGLISTHGPRADRYFRLAAGYPAQCPLPDELSNGRMTFDFKLRDGVVTKSNAMELMRSIGLEV